MLIESLYSNFIEHPDTTLHPNFKHAPYNANERVSQTLDYRLHGSSKIFTLKNVSRKQIKNKFFKNEKWLF